jgi:hypothetical protein
MGEEAQAELGHLGQQPVAAAAAGQRRTRPDPVHLLPAHGTAQVVLAAVKHAERGVLSGQRHGRDGAGRVSDAQEGRDAVTRMHQQ